MLRSICGGIVLAVCSLSVLSGAPRPDDISASPMRFALHHEGSAETCGTSCRVLISASGMITADTPREFEAFARERDVRGATIVLDSKGGSVLGAIALGRAFRSLGMTTTVGRIKDAGKRVTVLPRADCQSMCPFVLLGGVKRVVPSEARVLVHQIWLGDRRDDAVAANYSAEDLVLVQRDIGKLVNTPSRWAAAPSCSRSRCASPRGSRCGRCRAMSCAARGSTTARIGSARSRALPPPRARWSRSRRARPSAGTRATAGGR